MARWAGKSGLIELQGPGVAPVIVANLSTWSLNATKDKIDVTAFGDANVVRVLGFADIQGDFDAFWDDGNFQIQATAEYTSAAYTLVIYPNGAIATAHYHTGPAWLDYSLSSGVKDAVKMKATWVAAGSWSRV